MFFDAAGKALGYFKAGQWREAIDSDKAKQIAAIENPHLKRVAQYIEQSIEKEKERDFIDDFIGTIDDALANIHPEKTTECRGAALLIGRPVAVVRASLNLELCGSPAVNQDWNVFRRDMAKTRRTTDDFTKVKFPVRLGEYGQLNDGLVGYWLERKNTAGQIEFEQDRFYSPQSDYIDSVGIESRFHLEHQSDDPINFHQSIDDPPQGVTMLMDVQGTVHATVGILPNKEISIPVEQYKQALQNIEVSFLYAPLVTQAGKINLPLRGGSDYAWSWVERKSADSKEWIELFPENRIEKQAFVEQWNKASGEYSGNALWSYLLGEDVKWLAAVDDNEDGQADVGRAKVVNKEDRASATLGGSYKKQDSLVASILETYSVGIAPVNTAGIFTGQQEIKEGWLKLRRKQG